MNLGTLLKQNHISAKIDIPMKSKRFIDTYEMMSLNHQVSSLDEFVQACEQFVNINNEPWTISKQLPLFASCSSADDFKNTYKKLIEIINDNLTQFHKQIYDDLALDAVWFDIIRIQNQLKANNIANN